MIDSSTHSRTTPTVARGDVATAGENRSQPTETSTEAVSSDIPREAKNPGNTETQSANPINETAADPPHFLLRNGDRLVLTVAATITAVLMLAHWARLSGWGLRSVEIERHPSREYDYRIDVNEATWVEWLQLEGVGENLARRIVDDRERNGPFESIDDLDRVKGIGPKTIEKLRPWLKIRQRE